MRVTAEPRRRLRLTALGALATVAAVPIGVAVADQRDAHAASDKASKGTRYKGKTSQGRHVSFKVRNGSVKRPKFLIVHRNCGAEVTFTGADKIGRSGRFSFGGSPGHYFKGRFVSSKKVRGRAAINVSDTSCPGSGEHAVSYTAHRAG